MDDVDLENLEVDIAEVKQKIAALQEMVAKLVESHNQVGQNVAWLVANTQGLFQTLQNPEFMNQIMGQVLGGKLPGMGVSNSGG